MILITGGMGFVGLHTARAFLDAGEDVVVTRFRASREPGFLAPHAGTRFFAETIDITNPFDVIELVRKYRVTGIVHLAVPPVGAVGGLSVAEEYRINMTGLINILEAARIGGVRRVSLASSIAVYSGVSVSDPGRPVDRPVSGPFREIAALPPTGANPASAYKKTFEILGDYYAGRTGLEVVSLRLAGIYGPLYHSMSNLPSRLVHAAFKGVPGPMSRSGQGVPYAEDGIDMVYARDGAEGIRSVQMAPRLSHRLYNIGSGRATSGREVAEAVKIMFPRAEIALQPGNGPDAIVDNYLDLSRTTADTGWTPRYSTEAAIADYVEWLRAGNPH